MAKSRRRRDVAKAEQARKRAARMPEHELLGWIEQATLVIGQDIDAYRKHGKPESLADAQLANDILYELLDVLLER